MPTDRRSPVAAKERKVSRKGSADAPAKKAAAAKKPAKPPAKTAAAPRVNERVRARTRAKLLQAARIAMGRNGIAGTAINDITGEAGVAFGSFYNYFSSKDEIARAVFIEDMLAIADLLDRIRPADADIAVIVGLNIRQTMRHTLDDPIWGWFFVHAASSVGDLVETMGGRLARDIRIGVDAGRFHCADVLATMDCIIGGALHVLRQVLEGRRPPESVDRFTEFALRGLGIRDQEIPRIMKAAQQYEAEHASASRA
ncbi:TetR/AcrR family transcriptional regulator [Paraburkholderia sp. J76]|uniref:TetR/AcrR family transcriptional regulator n=1 Tax=Paraburkholderia sp. J76 TaxID=2805439 RepID=UPI002ABD7957|nr:TetR/AcrR family transcriptional regulator [Paraburkholderia sp. J76]